MGRKKQQVLRLRATSAVSRDKSVQRFAPTASRGRQDDDSVGGLTDSVSEIEFCALHVVAERWISGCMLRFMHAKNHFSDTLRTGDLRARAGAHRRSLGFARGDKVEGGDFY
jgi:hypothetical protein